MLPVFILACAAAAEDVVIKVLDAGTGKPIFARVVLTDAAGGVIGSSGYRALRGRFVAPDGFSLALAPGIYRAEVDAGFEFIPWKGEIAVAGAGEKTITLARWVDFRREGWYAGGDHNHLIRDGAGDKNYGGTGVTLEFAAALQASCGWSYFAAGGGGPWTLSGGGACNARDEDNTTVNHGRGTEAACAEWNRRYGEHLHLWWNNEILKTRWGHVWFLGRDAVAPSYPYTDRPGDAWWAFYDDHWDPWQTGDKSRPIGPYRNGQWELPPVFDCLRSWSDRGLAAVYAHPTRTFLMGKNRVSNIAVEFPFDLLAGAPVGGLAVMGDAPDHREDQALWFAALDEGFQVPGVAENDTVFGRADIRARPHVTYTYVPDMGPAFDLAKLAAALTAGRNFLSSGAFCTLRADGAYGIGDTVPETGQPHQLEVRAWASSDPADAIGSLEIIADGRTAARLEAASGKRQFAGHVSLSGARWTLAKVVCRDRTAVAITNPIYFHKPGEPPRPEPLRTAVSGRVTHRGRGVPAEVVVTAWGREVARARAGADGSYRLDGVPIAAHLAFRHQGASTSKTVFFDDPEFADIHRRIYRTDFAGAPGALGGVFPPDCFRALREMAREATIDAALE